MRTILAASMETELSQRLGYQPYHRDPGVHTDYHNGYYPRDLDTQFGPPWQARRLLDRYQYLVLEGVGLKVKGACGLRKLVARCVYGISYDGRRERHGFRLAKSESESEWTALREDLRLRRDHGDAGEGEGVSVSRDRDAGVGFDAGDGGLCCGGELGGAGPDLDAAARVPGDLAAQGFVHGPQGDVGHTVLHDGRWGAA